MYSLVLLFIIFFLSSCAPSRVSEREPSSVCPLPSQGTYHVVRKADTLWKISKQYGVNVETIMRDNHIVSTKDLRIGQKLLISSPRFVKDTCLFIWPLSGQVVNYFGENVDNSVNRGINIKTDAASRQVRASASGQVVFSNYLKGWGKAVIVRHDSNFYTIYANLDETLIAEGTCSRQGEVIGKVASAKDGSYILHFEIRKRYIPQNPLTYLN